MSSEPEITTMGKKGQVVVPKAIRDRLGLGPQTKFVIYASGDTVIMKKLTLPDIKKEWDEIFRIMDEKNIQLSEEEINQEIQAVRQAKRKRNRL